VKGEPLTISRIGSVVVVALAVFTSCSPEPIVFENRCHFIAITDFAPFTRTAGETDAQVVLTSPELAAPFDWDELVVSWNAVTPAGTGLKVEARGLYPDRATRFFTLGYWSEDPARLPRESVKRQKDAEGEVQTDTLVLRKPASRVQLRIRLTSRNGQVQPQLKFIGISLLESKARLPRREPNRLAWGKVLPVPELSQLAQPGGQDWCSPTCVSMVLAHWAKTLGRPELDVSVPEVAKAVDDPNWPGTGNWPFNTAFAGKLPGLRAWVTRLRGVTDLEDWIAAGVPPIVSLSSDLLQGKAKDEGNGHLVVCVGFTEQGDVWVNDPWARLEKGEKVRRVYPRQNLVRAWTRSKNTVYLIDPEGMATPF